MSRSRYFVYLTNARRRNLACRIVRQDLPCVTSTTASRKVSSGVG